MSSLHGPSCGQPTADEASEAVRANRQSTDTQGFKQSDADTHTHTRRVETEHLTGRQCGVSVRGGSDTYRTTWLHA